VFQRGLQFDQPQAGEADVFAEAARIGDVFHARTRHTAEGLEYWIIDRAYLARRAECERRACRYVAASDLAGRGARKIGIGPE
jgi:hypothetical protein